MLAAFTSILAGTQGCCSARSTSVSKDGSLLDSPSLDDPLTSHSEEWNNPGNFQSIVNATVNVLNDTEELCVEKWQQEAALREKVRLRGKEQSIYLHAQGRKEKGIERSKQSAVPQGVEISWKAARKQAAVGHSWGLSHGGTNPNLVAGVLRTQREDTQDRLALGRLSNEIISVPVVQTHYDNDTRGPRYFGLYKSGLQRRPVLNSQGGQGYWDEMDWTPGTSQESTPRENLFNPSATL